MRTPAFMRTATPPTEGTEKAPPEKLPLPLCFLLSHLEEEAVVRLDGVKVGVARQSSQTIHPVGPCSVLSLQRSRRSAVLAIRLPATSCTGCRTRGTTAPSRSRTQDCHQGSR